jgi:hypothetical protein
MAKHARHDDEGEDDRPAASAPVRDLPRPAAPAGVLHLPGPIEPGWSNAPEDHGIASRESKASTPSGGIDMSQPGWSNNGPAATGATAGTPGTWTPPLADTPNNLALMTSVTASPATTWTTGQYVVLGDGNEAHWSGSGWILGRA